LIRNNKLGTTFFSSGNIGYGQETTALTCIPFFVHFGMLYVPIGSKTAILNDNSEPRGGSAYGAGTFADTDDKRTPSELELKV
jgi:NAD(P)H dehydrogenase (quinone)